jgi:hypothetical protein
VRLEAINKLPSRLHPLCPQEHAAALSLQTSGVVNVGEGAEGTLHGPGHEASNIHVISFQVRRQTHAESAGERKRRKKRLHRMKEREGEGARGECGEKSGGCQESRV